MRVGSTWLCDIVSGLIKSGWKFWKHGNQIPMGRFIREAKTKGTTLIKLHHKDPELICKNIDAKIISMSRDIFDTIISKIFYVRYNQKIKYIPTKLTDKDYVNEFVRRKYFMTDIQEWKLFRKETSCVNHLKITYEELSSDPIGTTTKISKFLGLNDSVKHISRIVRNNSFKGKTGRNSGGNNNKRFRRKGIVGDHKNWLTEESIKIIRDEMN